MNPDPNDQTVAASASSAADRNETASIHETGRGAPPGAAVELSFLAPAQAADEIGRLGKYRILGVLGHGGMGLVFRAEDPALKRLVAVKVMLPRFASDPHARARFIREARAQAAVEHDHIVPIHDVSDAHDPPFIVMPLLKGMTLADALKANPRPPLPAILRIGREIAEGLAAAHESGLIHRDIKPANIWLEGGKLRVRILDFGLARAAAETDPAATGAEPLTADGAVVGTPMYMSPEQARGEELDARTDNFSLGVILYQMATGELPFTGRSTAAVLLAVVSHEPKQHESANLPPPLVNIISRLLTKDRDAAGRPAAAAVIAEELKQIEYGLSAVQVVPLDSIPDSEAAANPFAEIDSTEMDAEPAPRAVREKKPPSKAWILGGVAALIAVLATAGVMFKVMTKTDPPVVKNEEPAPAPAPKPPAPKPKEQPPGLMPNWEQRKAIEAVLVMGGKVGIVAGGSPELVDAANKLPSGAYSVDSVSFDSVPLDDEKVAAVKHLPPVAKGLGLKDSGVTNDQFQRIASYPCFAGIVSLDLSGVKMTDESLVHLKNFPALNHLDLTRTSVTSAGLVHLRGLPLEWVSFHMCGGLTDAGLESLGELTTLTHVWFMYTNVTEKGVAKLGNCGRIRYLHPGHCSDAIGETILKFPLLEDLHLGGSKTTGQLLNTMKKLPKLRYVQMSELVADADLAALQGFPSLMGASFVGCGDRITDAAAEHLGKCPRLTGVNVRKTKVTKAGAERLSDMLPACTVSYEGGAAGPRTAPPADSLGARRALEFALSRGARLSITAGGMVRTIASDEGLPEGPFTVGTLNLSAGRSLTAADAPRLVSLPAVTHNLFLPPATDDALLAKLATIPGLLEATVIGLENSAVTDDGLVVLASFRKLTEVRLSATSITGRGLAHLRGSKVEIVLLSRCKKLDDSAMESLAGMDSLTQLVVDGTAITEAGLAKLAVCQKLGVVDARNTNMTKSAAEALSTALPKCKVTTNDGAFGPKNVELAAAEALRQHGYQLNLRMPDGKTAIVTASDPLPAAPFVILSIAAPKARLPERFVPEVLLPAVSNLSALESIADPWFFANWSESDLAAFAKSPGAARLTGLRGSIALSTANIATLKIFPKLSALSAAIGPDTAWGDFEQLRKLDWLLLAAKGSTGIPPAAWKTLSTRTFTALELDQVVIDDASAEELARIKLKDSALLTFNACPGLMQRLGFVAKNPSVRVLTFGDPAATDADLVKLEAFKQVKRMVLWMYPPKVSPAAVEALSAKLPQCEIVYGDRSFGPVKK